MNKQQFEKLNQHLIGYKISKPISGTLSGHAAGEPFEKIIYQFLKGANPLQVFKQFEYLNDLYRKNPTVIGHKARSALFNSPTLLFLLSRGVQATDKWSETNLFEEKQNDTADILQIDSDFYELIDVKTRNIDKSAQAPNIISAYKLAQVCAKMIDNQEFDVFSINYLEVDWKLEQDALVCKNLHYAELFKANPQDLYINWAAAMQIQFHVCDLDQTFSLSREDWAKQYLQHFVTQAKRRADDMINKFVKPFEKYF
ncbi:MAG: HincII family type II restriction endonuclease [Haemophilus parainfluenzae]|nr:HincII family type II restriction endonuclease [Haemophilus parainfluenzae]